MQQMNRPDPAPSRWAYRFQRLMLTPMYRRTIKVGLPLAVVLGAAGIYLGNPERQAAIVETFVELRERFETRPEFMVNLMAVEGATPETEEDIREIFPHDLPASSFDIDLDEVRETIAGLPAVAQVSVRIRQGGVLVAEVTERQPAAIWRSRDGLGVVDATGVVIGGLTSRTERPDLPVIAGRNANRAVPEALAILRAAAPLEDRLRGLVRIGERRWDVVLDRGQRIFLPEKDPVRALERVIVLADLQDMLERDVAAIDMRLGQRPTIRMNQNAVEEWWRITGLTSEAETQ